MRAIVKNRAAVQVTGGGVRYENTVGPISVGLSGRSTGASSLALRDRGAEHAAGTARADSSFDDR
jgi:hypothetical protein